MADDVKQAAGTARAEKPATRDAAADRLERAEEIVHPEREVVRRPPPHPDYPSYRVEPGTPIHLADLDPGATEGFADKHEAEKETKRQTKRIEDLQDRLYAENSQSLLIVLQAIDTGGKDGTIRHVFSGVNPQGCQVWSFKQPSVEEMEHDFLWRYHARVPERGMMAIFNRSHYEDVLVVRVHDLVPEKVWRQRYAMINNFERMLTLNRITIIKFFLHISRDEQRRRLESRLDNPDKRWKFSEADLKERVLWDRYQGAFEDAINNCSTDYAPWYVVPANKKWYRDLVVSRTIADTLEAMSPQYPSGKGISPEAITIPD
jgi:PPK2 family polyphosphate:nucleotide phosphotransferase